MPCRDINSLGFLQHSWRVIQYNFKLDSVKKKNICQISTNPFPTSADQKREKRERYMGQSNLPNGHMNTIVGKHAFQRKKHKRIKAFFYITAVVCFSSCFLRDFLDLQQCCMQPFLILFTPHLSYSPSPQTLFTISIMCSSWRPELSMTNNHRSCFPIN